MSDFISTDHVLFLNLALEQAKLRRGFCSPNPSVGAIAVRDGKIIGRAYHYRAGANHAEAALIKKLPKGLKHVTLYVTLEPCNHWGKTPPCIDAIIDYGISKVVYGYSDPNIHTEKDNTQKILSQHGIEVLHYPLPEIDAFYASYAFWLGHRLPFITAKWAQSLDAKVGYPNQRVILSNAKAFEYTHLCRQSSDLILTTAATIYSDNPRLNVRLPSNEYDKPIAVIDTHLRLTGQERIFESKEAIHIFYQKNYKPRWQKSNVFFHPVASGLDLRQVGEIIASLGYHDVWLEAGPRFMASMHKLNLVQKTHVFITPKLLGEQGLDAFVMNYPYFNQAFLLQSQQLDDNILATFLWREH